MLEHAAPAELSRCARVDVVRIVEALALRAVPSHRSSIRASPARGRTRWRIPRAHARAARSGTHHRVCERRHRRRGATTARIPAGTARPSGHRRHTAITSRIVPILDCKCVACAPRSASRLLDAHDILRRVTRSGELIRGSARHFNSIDLLRLAQSAGTVRSCAHARSAAICSPITTDSGCVAFSSCAISAAPIGCFVAREV